MRVWQLEKTESPIIENVDSERQYQIGLDIINRRKNLLQALADYDNDNKLV